MKNSPKAIKQLEPARPYDRGTPPSGAPALLFYTVEFQKVIDGRNIVVSDQIGALAHLQLGRALAIAGDKVKAKTAYQDFVTLWKDADRDIPVFMEAKTEFAKLQ